MTGEQRSRSTADSRFGPSIATWQKVVNTREYVQRGAQSSVGFYIGSVGLMLVLALLGRAQQGAYVSLVYICS